MIDERRAVAGLVLRSAEAKLRRSADLTLRASLDHRPLDDPRSLVRCRTEEDAAAAAASAKASHASAVDAPAGVGARRRENRAVIDGSDCDVPNEPRLPEPCKNQLADSNGAPLVGTCRMIPAIGANCYLPSGNGERGGDKDCGAVAGSNRDSGRPERGSHLEVFEATPAEDGLRELKQEILDLEGKILGRLSSGSSNSGGSSGDKLPKEAPGPHVATPSGDRGGDQDHEDIDDADSTAGGRHVELTIAAKSAARRVSSKKRSSAPGSSTSLLVPGRPVGAEAGVCNRGHGEKPLARNARAALITSSTRRAERTRATGLPPKTKSVFACAPRGRSGGGGVSGSYGDRYDSSSGATAAVSPRHRRDAPRVRPRAGSDVLNGDDGGGAGVDRLGAPSTSVDGARANIFFARSRGGAYYDRADRERRPERQADGREGGRRRWRPRRRGNNGGATMPNSSSASVLSSPLTADASSPEPHRSAPRVATRRGGLGAWSEGMGRDEDDKPLGPGTWGVSSVSDCSQAFSRGGRGWLSGSAGAGTCEDREKGALDSLAPAEVSS